MTKIMTNAMYGERFSAIITGEELGYYVVVTEFASFKAQKAFSCLVEPKINDKVMLLKADEQDLYITDILTRSDEGSMEIVAKDGMSIKTQNGDLNLSSENNITLNATESLNGFADEANVVISKLSFLTKLATLKSDTLNIIASIYQGAIDNLHLNSENVVRHVSQHEEVQCNSSRKIVKESDIYNVKESITIAEGQVKIDAQQINMG